jgi:hypothetical protein
METMLGISWYVFPVIVYIFFSIKLEKRAEQILPGNKRGGRKGEGVGGRGEKWHKQCMHI